MNARIADRQGERAWNTAGMPETDRFAFWQQLASEAFCPVTVRRPDGRFESSGFMRRVGAIEISRITSAAQHVTRNPAPGQPRSGDAFFVNLPLSSGTSARQDGRIARLDPGDFTIIDSTCPFELNFTSDFDQISLAIPHELIAHTIPDPSRLTAVPVAGDRGIGALAAESVRRVLLDRHRGDRTRARIVSDRLANLIALALGGSAAATRLGARALLLHAILDETDRSLADPDLTPARLAASIHISTRYLHSILSDHGITFGRWLTTRRLQRCHQALRDPEHNEQEISEIALRNGDRDPSHFARAYRVRYETTPSATRRQSAQRGAQQTH
jgi:AraC-like DNA-binding protein